MKHNRIEDVAQVLLTRHVYPSVIASTLKVIDFREDLFSATEKVEDAQVALETVRADNIGQSPYLLSQDSSVLRREAALDLQFSERNLAISEGAFQDSELAFDAAKLEQEAAFDDLGMLVLAGAVLSRTGSKRLRKMNRPF